MKNKIICLSILGLTVFVGINAQEFDLESIGFTFKGPIELYQAGLQALKEKDEKRAIQSFRDAKKAKSTKMITMEDYVAKIGSLEQLIAIYKRSSTPESSAVIEKYSNELILLYDEALTLSHISADQAERAYGKKIASALNSMLTNNGRYTGLDGLGRVITLTPESIKFINSSREKYLGKMGLSGREELKELSLQKAYNFIIPALTAYNRAQEMLISTADEIKARDLLYKDAFNDFMKAAKEGSDLYNVEYHLAIMFLKGLGTDEDLQLAQLHIQNALNAAQGDQKKLAENLKNEIQARLLMQQAVQKLKESEKIIMISTKEQVAKEKLEKEAFELFQQASALYAGSFEIEFELAQMYHDATGTKYEPSRAMGHLKTARNLATSREEIADITALEKEINERNAKVNAVLAAKRKEGTKEESAFIRIGLMQPQIDRTQIMKDLYKRELAKPSKKTLMNRLFGTTILQESAPQSEASSSRSSISEASSSSASTTEKRKTKASPFGFSF